MHRYLQQTVLAAFVGEHPYSEPGWKYCILSVHRSKRTQAWKAKGAGKTGMLGVHLPILFKLRNSRLLDAAAICKQGHVVTHVICLLMWRTARLQAYERRTSQPETVPEGN